MRNIKDETAVPRAGDRATRYTMRVIGVLLAAAALFLLAHDYFASGLSQAFFMVGALLGTLTAIAGWLPDADERPAPSRKPAYQVEHAVHR